MDALDTILNSVRLDTSILSQAVLRAPFAVESGTLPHAVFHAVVSGSCCAHLAEGSPAVTLSAGHIVLLPRGDNHIMASDPAAPPETAPCRVICGTVSLEHEAATWLLQLLPPLIHASAGPGDGWVPALVASLERELGSSEPGVEATVKRFTEMLVVHTLRRFATDPDSSASKGWVAAVRDARIGKALAYIHNDPETCWSVPDLAARIGMSRTRFFQRFTDLVGMPPARYMTRWRLSRAATLMRHNHLSTEEIASRVGYASVDSFRTAFRRHVGKTVPAYRRAIDESA